MRESMRPAARLSDKGTQHDGFYETAIIAGSLTVFIDGLPAARMGDPLTPHDKAPTIRPIRVKSPVALPLFSLTASPAARTGDAIDCGGVVHWWRYGQHRLITFSCSDTREVIMSLKGLAVLR